MLADIKNAEIAKNQPLDEAGILTVFAREVRQRQESIEAFRAGNRADLVARETAELAVIKSYLPEPATREEIIAAVRRIIGEVGAKGPADRGKVIPKVIAELKGKASGQEISAVVAELLGAAK